MGITLSCRAFVVTCALGAGLVAAGPAGAAPATTGLPPNWQLTSATITGDITGDGVVDRFELAGRPTPEQSTVCGVLLRAGVGSGSFADPVLYRLPVGDQGGECPELGVVLTAPTAAQNRLAVTYQYSSGLVQAFDFADGRFTAQSRFTVGFAPNVLATKDFDGDGFADVWTLAGDGFSTFTAVVSRGRTWTTVYDTPGDLPASPQFLDLNHDGGTDILVNWSSSTATGAQGSGVDVVDGKTGQIVALARTRPDQPRASRGSFFDADHDDFLDVRVDTTNAQGRALGQRVFLNRSQGGGWSFVPST